MSDKAFHEQPFKESIFKIVCRRGYNSFNFPPHYHREVEMIYVDRGSLKLSVLNKNFMIQAGQLAIVGCNHIHSYKSSISELNKEHNHYILLFDWKFFSHIFTETEEQQLLYPILFDVNIISCEGDGPLRFVPNCIRELHQETMVETKANHILLLAGLYRLMGGLIRYGDFHLGSETNMKQMQQEHHLLSKVNEFIINEYTKGIYLKDAAKALGYSDYHFSRQFKRYTGITFKKYLIQYQIAMAREDVVDDKLRITEIAFKHGFNSIKTFNRIFKDYYGCSPTAYRKNELNSQEQ